MRDVNELEICRDEYQSNEDFENAILKAVMVLLDNNYIATIKYDDKGFGIVAIQFNPADREWGYDYPYWLSPEEFDSVIYNESE